MILTPLSKEEIEQVENSIFDLAFDLELESGIVALPFYYNVEKEGIVIGLETKRFKQLSNYTS